MIIALCIDILSNNGTLIKIYSFNFVKPGDNNLGVNQVVEKFINLLR
jgi:hypothetical protein